MEMLAWWGSSRVVTHYPHPRFLLPAPPTESENKFCALIGFHSSMYMF